MQTTPYGMHTSYIVLSSVACLKVESAHHLYLFTVLISSPFSGIDVSEAAQAHHNTLSLVPHLAAKAEAENDFTCCA